MILTVEELSAMTLYPEIIRQITRDNEEEARKQIRAAQKLVQSFLGRYDTDALFGIGDDPPEHTDELVQSLVCTVATYYLVRKSSPGVHLEIYRDDYEDAIRILKDIRDGKNGIQVPYAKDDPHTDTDESGLEVRWDSNVKRNNFF